MFSEKRVITLLHIFVPILIIVGSIFIGAAKVPQSEFIQSTLESVEDSKTTVLEFTGATTAASLAISALPNDFATPLANNFASMSKYFVIILISLFIERLILVIGVKMAFMYVIPAACGLYVVGYLTKKNVLRVFASKIAILGLALIFVVPCSVKFTNNVGAEYLASVDETIEKTSSGADKINDEMTNGDESSTIFEKLSDAFKTAIKGVTDILDYFNDMIKKCINSIAILIVTDFVMPLATLILFRWLLKELFGLIIPITQIKNFVKKDVYKSDGDIELIEEE